MPSPKLHAYTQVSHRQNTELKQKLFAIATRPSKLHTEAEIVLPDTSGRIREEQLFRSEKHRKHRKYRRVLELGSGSGEFLAQWLQEHPEDDYTAFEIKSKRIRKTLAYIRKANLNVHLKVVPINFNWLLEDILPPRSFDIVIINFPDPWPKSRHWKHRLVQKGFDKRIHALLGKQARIYLSTDYGPYARKILSLFRQSPYFHSFYPWPHYLREHPQNLPFSRFEKIHQNEGRRSYYFCWECSRESKS